MHASTIVALSALSLALCSTAASTARADETARVASPAPPGKTITVELKIKGRGVHPGAAIDVSRLVQRAPLPELRQPLLDRIGAAVEKAPF